MGSSDDYYAVLGVSRTATPEQIRIAYRELAKEFHPDRHSNEGDADLASYATHMSLISEAYEVLADEQSRKHYDQVGSVGWQTSGESTYAVRQPNADECMFCAYHPVVTATLRRNVGMVFLRKHAVFTVRACRGCGMKLARDMQNSTLVLGWLGIISFFANVVAVLGNAGAILKFSRLDDPSPPTDRVARPIAEPSYQGRSIFLRSGIYIACVVLSIAVIAIAHSSANTGSADNHWAVSDCVSSQGHYITSVVSCSVSHFGMIVALETNQQYCPQTTTNYFTEKSQDPSPGTVVCIVSGG